jgi:hypothetical protein
VTTELQSGVFTDLVAKAGLKASAATAVALEATAAATAHQATVNASTGRHSYGTPTPARPGTGPAIISGTLTGAVDYSTAIAHGVDWVCRVGVKSGRYPTYNGKTSSTPASRYGYYLDTGLRNGTTYPWLLPSRHIAALAAPRLFQQAFGAAFDTPVL